MSVTRKHFEAIAAALAKVDARPLGSGHAHKECCLNVAYALKKFNPAFNFEKFMDACGYSYSREGAFYYLKEGTV